MSYQTLVERLHNAACARNENGYIDPKSGLFVLTAKYLLDRGKCCDSGCRHCPYASKTDKQTDSLKKSSIVLSTSTPKR